MGKRDFDVIIIGSGIAGSTTATILAAAGADVLLIEKGTHPRFAVGESLTAASIFWLWILGKRYDIPEITALTHLDTIVRDVSPRSGVKQTFGFAYHRAHQPQDPDEMHKVVPPCSRFVQESHLFREDVDAYMVEVAIRYGAVYRDRATVQAFSLGDDGVSIELADGTYRAHYCIDASGYRSVVAHQLGLRDEVPRTGTHSRSIFTHMAGIRPYDELPAAAALPRARASLHEGTLHHVFDGGWFWVIPFDNHAQATNTLCSVGVTVDPRKFPPRDVSPEQEFTDLVARFPDVTHHLADGEPMRDFVRTGRLQYSARSCLGPRSFLLGHSYAFVDPLYSQGMAVTFETIAVLMARLLPALRAGDFATEQFTRLDALQAAQLVAADRLVCNAYRAMADFSTWNAWQHFWLASVFTRDLYLARSCLKYIASGDPAVLDVLVEQEPRPGSGSPMSPAHAAVLNRVEAELIAMEADALPPAVAAERILATLGAADWLPPRLYGWGDAGARHLDLVPARMVRTVMWGKFRAPQALRRDVFDFPLATVARLELGSRVLPFLVPRLARQAPPAAAAESTDRSAGVPATPINSTSETGAVMRKM